MNLPDKLQVQQVFEPLEVFTGLESKNKYRVLDESGKDLLFAYEKSGFFARNMLDTHRPLEIMVMDGNQKNELSVKRDFFFFKPQYSIKDENGNALGYVKKKSLVSIFKFKIMDANDSLKYMAQAKVTSPWTYKVFENDQEQAVVSKKWSGFGKEAFTDADNFFVDYGSVKDQNLRKLLLGFVFALDLTKFEKESD